MSRSGHSNTVNHSLSKICNKKTHKQAELSASAAQILYNQKMEGFSNLQDCVNRGIVDIEILQAQKDILKKETKELLYKVHPYAITGGEEKQGKGKPVRVRYETYMGKGNRPIRGKSVEEVEEKLLKFYGLTEQSNDNSLSPYSLEALFPQWIAEHKKEVKANTIKSIWMQWNRHFAGDPIVKRSLIKLTVKEIDHWLTEKSAGKLTLHQYNDLRSIWNGIEEYAVKEGILPYSKIKQTPRTNGLLPNPKKRRSTHTVAVEEYPKLREVCWEKYYNSKHNTCYLGVLMDTHLGERVGEICCIRWDDIHWDGHYMTIWQQNLPQFSYDSENHPVFLGYQVKENLKAGHAERNVPMSPAVEEILRFIQNVQTELGIKTDYVFSDEQGAPKRPRCFERAVKSVLEAAGWTRKRGGLHLLRFSFVSNVSGKAATGKEVQAYVGHEDYSTTENTYHILSEIPEKDAGQRISAVYGDFGGIIPVSREK